MKKILAGLIAAICFVGNAQAVYVQEGFSNTYNITSATVIKTSPGRIYKISVIVAGSAAGTVNDVTTTGAVSANNEVAVIPNTVGVTDINWPMNTGIVIVPGTGQTVSISWE